jgi:hypothetical protein
MGVPMTPPPNDEGQAQAEYLQRLIRIAETIRQARELAGQPPLQRAQMPQGPPPPTPGPGMTPQGRATKGAKTRARISDALFGLGQMSKNRWRAANRGTQPLPVTGRGALAGVRQGEQAYQDEYHDWFQDEYKRKAEEARINLSREDRQRSQHSATTNVLLGPMISAALREKKQVATPAKLQEWEAFQQTGAYQNASPEQQGALELAFFNAEPQGEKTASDPWGSAYSSAQGRLQGIADYEANVPDDRVNKFADERYRHYTTKGSPNKSGVGTTIHSHEDAMRMANEEAENYRTFLGQYPAEQQEATGAVDPGLQQQFEGHGADYSQGQARLTSVFDQLNRRGMIPPGTQIMFPSPGGAGGAIQPGDNPQPQGADMPATGMEGPQPQPGWNMGPMGYPMPAGGQPPMAPPTPTSPDAWKGVPHMSMRSQSPAPPPPAAAPPMPPAAPVGAGGAPPMPPEPVAAHVPAPPESLEQMKEQLAAVLKGYHKLKAAGEPVEELDKQFKEQYGFSPSELEAKLKE